MQIQILDLCLEVTRHDQSPSFSTSQIQRLSQIEQSLNSVVRNYLHHNHPEWAITVKLDGFYPVFTIVNTGAHGSYHLVYHYIDGSLQLAENFKATDSQLSNAKAMLDKVLSMTAELLDSVCSRNLEGRLIWA